MDIKLNKQQQYLSPNLSVDNFASVEYDPDYKTRNGQLSTWLRLFYADGTTIEMEYFAIADNKSDEKTTKEYKQRAIFGNGERIYPLQLNAATVPRLWTAKKQAIGSKKAFYTQLDIKALSKDTASHQSNHLKIQQNRKEGAVTQKAKNMGWGIGNKIKEQNGGRIATIIQYITNLKLTQSNAVVAVKAAINAIGLNAVIIPAPEFFIIAMIKMGVSKRILLVDTNGIIFDGLADLDIEEMRLVVGDIRC